MAGVPARAARRSRAATWILFLAFAFAVMGDPVSSVTYAVEAALRALGGNLALLLPAIGAVVALVALVDIHYDRLVQRFPWGGGSAAATAEAFGEAWAFLPLAALAVDYALTLALGVAAAAAALIAYVPALAPDRVLLALGMAAAVAAPTWFGHGGRALFAAMTLAFIAMAAVVLVHGFLVPAPAAAAIPTPTPGRAALPAIVLAYPVAMAFATGTEAPASAIAQLGQLRTAGRQRFGRATMWITLAVVGPLSLGFAGLALRLHLAQPAPHATLVATIAAAAVGRGPLFAAFQLTSALMLLAAANSGLTAGPGLLKALARDDSGEGVGVLPAWLGRTNRHHTPYGGEALFLGIAAVLVLAARGQPQVLVLFYAVDVMLAFLIGLLAMARLERRAGRRRGAAGHVVAAACVLLTLVLDAARRYPLAPLAAAAAGAALLYWQWIRAGRPSGIAVVEELAEVTRSPEPPAEAAE